MAARSKLDVHLHLHGKFADILPDELHLHLHADLDPKKDAVREALRAVGRLPYMLLGCTIYTPGAAQPTKVRAADSSAGVICCHGFARSNSMAPDRIFAKCYHADPGDPIALPIPGDAVEGVIIPAGDPNFCFDHTSGSQEIPNVRHSAGGGVQNWIVVWPVYGTTVRDASKRSFFGVTATETECQPSGCVALFRKQVQPAFHGPRQYRVRPVKSGNPHSAWPFEFTVHHSESESSPTEIAWTTVDNERNIIDSILWVTRAQDDLQATLAFRAVFGTKLSAPIVFRNAEWNPKSENTMIPDPCVPIASDLPKLIIKPA